MIQDQIRKSKYPSTTCKNILNMTFIYFIQTGLTEYTHSDILVFIAFKFLPHELVL